MKSLRLHISVVFTSLLLVLLATSPTRAISPISNDPQGFEGIKWNTALHTLKHLSLIDSDDRIQSYQFSEETLRFANTHVESLRLLTIDGKFARVMIRYQGEDSHQAIMMYLTRQYGPIIRRPGSMVRGLSQENTWRGGRNRSQSQLPRTWRTRIPDDSKPIFGSSFFRHDLGAWSLTRLIEKGHDAPSLSSPPDLVMNISTDALAINPQCHVTTEFVGQGRHKVVMADDFYQHPEDALQLALGLPYTNRFEIVGNFPGVRASLKVDTQPLFDKISELWGVPLYNFFDAQPAVFQGITNNNFQLNIGQRQPHIDQDITAMVYLNPVESCVGGTGLYRHRPTGLERVPIVPDQGIRELADRLELSDEFLNSEEGYENFQNSMMFNPLFANRDNTYINDGNEYWELLKLMEMKPNRLIIFDGRCFHSQHITPDQYTEAFRVNQVVYLSQKPRG